MLEYWKDSAALEGHCDPFRTIWAQSCLTQFKLKRHLPYLPRDGRSLLAFCISPFSTAFAMRLSSSLRRTGRRTSASPRISPCVILTRVTSIPRLRTCPSKSILVASHSSLYNGERTVREVVYLPPGSCRLEEHRAFRQESTAVRERVLSADIPPRPRRTFVSKLAASLSPILRLLCSLSIQCFKYTGTLILDPPEELWTSSLGFWLRLALTAATKWRGVRGERISIYIYRRKEGNGRRRPRSPLYTGLTRIKYEERLSGAQEP